MGCICYNGAVIGDKACPQLLEAMGETMKAVAMDIRLSHAVGYSTVQCAVGLYHPSNRSDMAARKERLRLSAIAGSCERKQLVIPPSWDLHGMTHSSSMGELTLYFVKMGRLQIHRCQPL